MCEDTPEVSRDTAIVAREAIATHLINRTSAMDRSKLKMAEKELAGALGYDPEFSDSEVKEIPIREGYL